MMLGLDLKCEMKSNNDIIVYGIFIEKKKKLFDYEYEVH
jgi:hypothetical protein